MQEGMGTEIVHKLAESDSGPCNTVRSELLEIVEVVLLAMIAVTAAWCGYQASKWDGHQALQYGTSARLRVEAAVAATEGGQQRLMDIVTFNAWIVAHEKNDERLATLYQRRFSPEYRIAFDAWLKTEPFKLADVSSRPSSMAEYHNAQLEKSAELNKEATAAFTDGTEARKISEKFVRSTVLLATNLFLVALAQRFKVRKARVGLLLVAAALMIHVLVKVVTYTQL